jgi:capsular exopolysaccharide synthesis family protein
MAMPEGTNKLRFEPTVLGAMWRYRWLALIILVVGAGLGAMYAWLQPARFEAVASFVVQDPQASTVFDTSSSQRPERFVADQVAILTSTVVTDRAIQIASEAGVDLTPDDLLQDATVVSNPDSDQIEIRYEAGAPETALAGANAIADAYQAVRREAVAQNYTLALEQLDESIASVGTELEGIAQNIADHLVLDPAQEVLDQQYSEALVRLAQLQDALTMGSTDQDSADQIRVALDDLLRQFQTLAVVAGLDKDDPELTSLLQQQTEAIGRQSNLIERRDQLKVDAELESTGIVVFAAALEAKKTPSDLGRALAIGLIAGAILGAGVSYLLSVRRRPFGDRLQPESILDAPFLGEVPEFRDEGIKSALPVLSRPHSAAAEAFRFVAAALDARIQDQGLESPGERGGAESASHLVRSLIVVSGRLGDGKTAVAANVALASARQGKRVLVIDADFGNQRLAGLFIVGESAPGLTEILVRDVSLEHVVQTLELPGGACVDILPRGLEQATAPEFFGSAAAQAFFRAVRERYDLVLVDAPPLLQVAYASTIARYVDRALVVVRHGGDMRATQELAERLALLGTATVGYVYNGAPLRPDMIRAEGSLKDVLGRGPGSPNRSDS